MSDKEGSQSHSPSPSPHKAKRSVSPKRSRSKTPRRRSRSHSNHGSRSHSRRGYHSRSRSRSYDRRRHSKYDGYDRSSPSSRRYSGSRSPMSSRRRHMGDRDHPRKSRCLGVFGLSLRSQERDIREIFERYGPIDDLQLVYDHHTGRSRGFGFVYMKYVEDAIEAKEKASGMQLDGRNIRIDYSITERAHTPTPGVYMGRTSGATHYGRKSPSPHGRGGRYSRSCSRSRSNSRRRY